MIFKNTNQYKRFSSKQSEGKEPRITYACKLIVTNDTTVRNLAGIIYDIKRMAKDGSMKTGVKGQMRISYHYKWPPANTSWENGFRCAATKKWIFL